MGEVSSFSITLAVFAAGKSVSIHCHEADFFKYLCVFGRVATERSVCLGKLNSSK